MLLSIVQIISDNSSGIEVNISGADVEGASVGWYYLKVNACTAIRIFICYSFVFLE